MAKRVFDRITQQIGFFFFTYMLYVSKKYWVLAKVSYVTRFAGSTSLRHPVICFPLGGEGGICKLFYEKTFF